MADFFMTDANDFTEREEKKKSLLNQSIQNSAPYAPSVTPEQPTVKLTSNVPFLMDGTKLQVNGSAYSLPQGMQLKSRWDTFLETEEKDREASDINFINYPEMKDRIKKAYALGGTQEEVAQLLAEKEREMYKQGMTLPEIASYYNRTASDLQLVRDITLKRDVEAYSKIYQKTPEDIKRRFEDARLIGAAPAVLMDDNFYFSLKGNIEKAREQKRGITENIANFFGNFNVGVRNIAQTYLPRGAALVTENLTRGAEERMGMIEDRARQMMGIPMEEAEKSQLEGINYGRKMVGLDPLTMEQWKADNVNAVSEWLLDYAAKSEAHLADVQADVQNGLTPNLIDKTGAAFGSVAVFYMTGGLGAAAAPAAGGLISQSFVAGLAGGGLEAMGEAGGVMHEQLKKGATVEQALSAANKTAILQYPIAALQNGLGWAFGGQGAIRTLLGRVLPEVAQETLQGVLSGMATGLKPNSNGDRYTWGDLFDAIPELEVWGAALREEGIPAAISAAILGAGEIAVNKFGKKGNDINLPDKVQIQDQLAGLTNAPVEPSGDAQRVDLGVAQAEDYQATEIEDELAAQDAKVQTARETGGVGVAEMDDQFYDIDDTEVTPEVAPSVQVSPAQEETVYGPQDVEETPAVEMTEEERVAAIPEVFVELDADGTIPTVEETQAAEQQAMAEAEVDAALEQEVTQAVEETAAAVEEEAGNILDDTAAIVAESDAMGTPVSPVEALDVAIEDEADAINEIVNEPTADELSAMANEQGFSEAELQADMQADQQAAVDGQRMVEAEPEPIPERPVDLPPYKNAQEEKRAEDWGFAYQQLARRGKVTLAKIYERLGNWTDKIFNSQVKKWVNEGRIALNKAGDIIASYVDAVEPAPIKGEMREVRNNDLIAIREIDANGIEGILSDGFSVAPSIGVVRVDNSRTDFGEVTIVYGPSTIDPAQDPENIIFKGDGWTPVTTRGKFTENRTAESELAKVKKQAQRDAENKAKVGTPRATVGTIDELKARREGGETGIGMGGATAATYDEAKPYRMVPNSEIRGIIYPSTVRESTKKQIRDSGIPSYEYTPETQGRFEVGQKKAVQAFVKQQNDAGNEVYFLRNPNEKGLFAGKRASHSAAATPSVAAAYMNALRMESRDATEEQIYAATGWYRGSDGLWRTELMDDVSKIGILDKDGKRTLPKKGVIGKYTLKDVYDNPRLYELYPELAGMRIDFYPLQDKTYAGFFDPNASRVVIGLGNSVQVQVETLIHEIQHAVQYIEGFAVGANTSMFVAKIGPDGKVITPFDQYWQSSGEVEARDAARRSMERYIANVRGKAEPDLGIPNSTGTPHMPSISLAGVNIPLSHSLSRGGPSTSQNESVPAPASGITFKARQVSEDNVRVETSAGANYDIIFDPLKGVWTVGAQSEVLGRVPPRNFQTKDQAINYVSQAIKSNLITLNGKYAVEGMNTLEGRWQVLNGLKMKKPSEFTPNDILAYQDWWRNFDNTNPMTWGLTPQDTMTEIQRLTFIDQYSETDSGTWTLPEMVEFQLAHAALTQEQAAIEEEADKTLTPLTPEQQQQMQSIDTALSGLMDKYKEEGAWPPRQWKENDRSRFENLMKARASLLSVSNSTYTLGNNETRYNEIAKLKVELEAAAKEMYVNYEKAGEKEFQRLVGKFSQTFAEYNPAAPLDPATQRFLDTFNPQDPDTWRRHEYDELKADYKATQTALENTTDPKKAEAYEAYLQQLEGKAEAKMWGIQKDAEAAANEKLNKSTAAQKDKKKGVNANITKLNSTVGRFFVPARNNSVKVGQEIIPIMDIKRAILDLVPVRMGRLPRTALGIMKVRESVIRLRGKYDIEAGMHEVGHYLETVFNLLDGIDVASPLFNELMTLGAVTSYNYPVSEQLHEGTAQYFLQYATDKVAAKQLYPEYTRVFEEAMAKNKDIAEKADKIAEMVSGYYSMSEMDQLLAHVDYGDAREQTIKERVQGTWEKVYTLAFDRYNNLKVLQDKVLKVINEQRIAQQLPVWDRLPDKFEFHGKAILAEGFKASVDKYTGELFGVVEKYGLQGETDRRLLTAVQVGERSLDYFANNLLPGTGLDEAGVRRVLSTIPQKYFDAAREMREVYQEALHESLVMGGLMTEESFQFYHKKWPHYVPFIRTDTRGNFDDDTANFFTGSGEGFVNLAEQVSKARGMEDPSESMPINDPFMSMFTNMSQFFAAKARNEIGQSLANIEAEFGHMGWLMERIETKKPGAVVSSANGDTVVSVWKDGARQYYSVDKNIYNILMMVGESTKPTDVQKAVGFLGALTPVLRFGATSGNIVFALKNVVGDAMNTFLQAENWTFPFQHLIEGMVIQIGAWNGKQKYIDIMNDARTQGVMRAGLVEFDATMRSMKSDINFAFKTDQWENGGKRALVRVVQGIQSIISTTEVAPKLAEFVRLKKMLGDDYVGSAALDATRVNTNFNIRGSVGQEMNRIVAFLNAGLQGTVNAGRVIRNHPVRSAARIGTLAFSFSMMSMLSYMLSDDEEKRKEYARIRRSDKDRYWYFNFGEQGLQLKKPQGPWNFFVGSLERMNEYIFNQDSHAFDGMWDMTWGSFMPNLMPSAGVFIEWLTNYNFFTGRAIVPATYQKLESSDQYDAKTSFVAKVIGKYTGFSPMKLDHLARGLGAGMGADLMHALDWVEGKDERPDRLFTELPVVGSFFGDAIRDGSQPEDWLYDAAADCGRAYESYKFRSEMGQAIGAPSKMVQITPVLEAAVDNLGKLNDKIKLLEYHAFGTPSERAEQVFQLKRQRVIVAEQARAAYDAMNEF